MEKGVEYDSKAEVDEGRLLLIVLTKVRHFCLHLLVISVKPLTFQPQDTNPGG
ncbi:hypothetical protein HanXRQr2_Chr04g0157261 [Helianthus annuus]|uniref:Uncharacterized protein n=1 Tax=Helianthus annuus TaxID=4232 RepID=A0A9K3J755_HELAN|nr:hypothetical protein HanXRQr2_Chr04g0157261 [Helianthus annuus]KAJ0930610.1 hypothetical protein HanPSC8_Chr04g0151371 [Helianthus annuus]